MYCYEYDEEFHETEEEEGNKEHKRYDDSQRVKDIQHEMRNYR